MRVIALLFLIQTTANAFFSINYSAEESHPALMTSPSVFKEVPTAEHVADIYARLSGLPPLLREGLTITVIRDIEIGEFVYTSVNSKERCHFFVGEENMPAVDILAVTSKHPILLEVSGGSKSLIRYMCDITKYTLIPLKT